MMYVGGMGLIQGVSHDVKGNRQGVSHDVCRIFGIAR